jgi:nicotinate-nucleotide adenylyltransferase
MELSARDDPAPQAALAKCRRVAFFGGSFDPPHLGHLAVSAAARDALHLDRVLFAPVGAQPLKPQGSTAPFADRVAMTKLAIAGESGFEVSLADAPSSTGQPNYTLNTLRSLRNALPPDGCLFCLMGADSFVSLRRWRGAAEIPFTASLVVASRPGQHLDDLARFLPEGLTIEAQSSSALPGEQGRPVMESSEFTASPLSHDAFANPIELRAYFLRNPAGVSAPFFILPGLDVEISASEIRSQIRSSAQDSTATRSLLSSPVADYIRAHGLYQQTGAPA